MRYCNMDGGCLFCDDLFCDGSKKNMNQWINVNDRLPEEDEYYIVYRQQHVKDVNRNLDFDCDEVSIRWYSDISGFGDENVTHWMALPKPPGKE